MLGLGSTETIGNDELPDSVSVLPLGGPVAHLAENSSSIGHMCAIRVDGGVRCWGANDSGQLGYGNTNKIGDNETVLDEDLQILDP